MGDNAELNLIEIILDMHSTMGDIRADVSSIKSTVNSDSARIEKAEAEIKQLTRQINLAHGAIALIGLAATAYSLLK